MDNVRWLENGLGNQIELEKEYDKPEDGIYQSRHPTTIQSFWHNMKNHIEEGQQVLERVREHVDWLHRVGGDELKAEIMELYNMSIDTALEVKFFEGKLAQHRRDCIRTTSNYWQLSDVNQSVFYGL